MSNQASFSPKVRECAFLALLVLLVLGCDPPEQIAFDASVEKSGAISREASPEDQGNSPEISNSGNVPTTAIELSPALANFLPQFDELSAKGFVPTLRSGSTGIGYTLETVLGIKENNSPGGDFMGMELKAFRDDDIALNDSEKMNLFLKEPKWIDGLRHADRVRNYGYVDSNGRNALYSTVTIETNSHKFCFEYDVAESKLWLMFDGNSVAFWDKQTLAKRLSEKHQETVFVSAHTKGRGKDEQFHYYGVHWCRDPSVDEFVDLLLRGDAMLELRMHLKESGSVRNHGSCFRIKQNRIKDLFEFSKQVRP